LASSGRAHRAGENAISVREFGVTPALLAIDVGSSRARALVFSLDGAILDEGSCPTPIEAPSPDQVILDPERLWDDLVAVIAGLGLGRFAVRGVGLTAQLGLVVLDRENKPLGPAMLWSDRRATTEAEEMNEAAGAAFTALSGRPMTPELAAPRLRWLARRRPSLFIRIHRVISLKDFILFRLTGAIVTDETHASYSGLFDVERRAWSADLGRLTGVDIRLLPPVRRATDVAGALQQGAASALRLAPDVLVAVGAPDGTIGTLGAGAVRPGVTVDVAGTTDVILHVVDRPIRDPEGRAILNAYAVPGLWAIGGATGVTGGAVAWVAKLLGYGSVADAEAALSPALAEHRSGVGALAFRPSLAGSRFPDWRPEQRGLIAGIESTHGPCDLFAAAEEGAAFTVAKGLLALQRSGVKVNELIVVGGLASKPRALQLRADVLDIPIVAVRHKEASAAGAAMLAGLVTGTFGDLTAAATVFVRYTGRFTPVPANVECLRLARARWTEIESAN
jgi:xylulokinase